ncbi:MAG TPA: alpha/beta hydrolase [Acidobacteriota bacterium]|nr:alpha/beta hydrolase [Acidobacteriota bacterium]
MLDFEATIDWGAARARVPVLGVPLPAAAAGLGKAIVAWRDGVEWDSLDHARGLDSLRAPLLVLHGEDDGVGPPATSRRLAERFPDRVMVITFPRADHAEAWNVDPDLYEAAVGSFLERELRGDGP